jgi:RNA ligase (TIGR02306 family)
VRLDQWAPGDKAVYFEPDSVVPAADWSAFLGDDRRIRARRFRGLYSQGLLIPAAEAGVSDAEVGVDVAERLGVTHWDPPEPIDGGQDAAQVPAMLRRLPAYDIENWRKHRDVFAPSEVLYVTEKLHGENARYCCCEGAMWVGSRTRWKKLGGQDPWNNALRAEPWIEEVCRRLPDHVIYGEVFGNNPGFRYGVQPGHRRFRVFDVLQPGGGWLDSCRLADLLHGHLVPLLHHGLCTADELEALAEGRSQLGDHIREGCVVKPHRERWDERVGRVALKIVGNGYLEKSR